MDGQKKMSKYKKWFLNSRDFICSLLFPPRCLVCDELLEPEEKQSGIHASCANRLYPILGAMCMHCGRPFGNDHSHIIISEYNENREFCYDCRKKGFDKVSNITQGKSLFLYKGKIKKSMYRFKYSNKREYANHFANVAFKMHGEWIKKMGIEVIIPVPMYPAKKRKRGYNQAESFGKKLSEKTGIPLDAKSVCRVIDTKPQKGLTEKERKNNLERAFQKGKSVVKYNRILVVDDIYTTGNTAEAVAREMIKQGAHRVYLMTICIGGDS